MATQNVPGTTATVGSQPTATLLAMQIVYNISRVPLIQGSSNTSAGLYYPIINGQIGASTQWSITNYAIAESERQS